MLKQPSKPDKNTLVKPRLIILGSGLVLAIAIGSIATPLGRRWLEKWQIIPQQTESQQVSAVLPLVFDSSEQRETQLKQIAEESQSNLDRHRARYLLAVDLLRQKQGKAALVYLEDLERDYEILAAIILLKQAQAYQLSGQETLAIELWQQVLATYGDSPAAAEALFQLANYEPSYRQQLIKQFPAHPNSQKIIRQLQQQHPERVDLLILQVKHSRAENLDAVRDTLVLDYPDKLTAEDWEAIAAGYWQAGEYRKAADAYKFSPLTPQNLYRAARGFHLNGNISLARTAYQRLIQEFHDAAESGSALLYLASISGGKEALAYLDIAIEKFSDRAPNALYSQALIYDALEQPQLAAQTRQKLLREYADSEISAIYRWKTAQKQAESGNFTEALRLLQPLPLVDDWSDAPKATFWAGKWAAKLGRKAEAEAAFQQTIAFYPQSYYAWRSAVLLGWDVGDFTSLRQLSPSLQFPQTNPKLLAASATTQELFQLGQYEDAWWMWQTAVSNPRAMSVEEQFSESLLLLASGKTALGVTTLLSLKERDEPTAKEQWRSLRQKPEYWQALFPFPHRRSILNSANQWKINPLLVISVMRKESNFAPKIKSTAGAVGLMQIVPHTAQWVAEQVDFKDYSLLQPEDNIKIGSWYLAYNHQRYQNNTLLAIASYNAGTGNVSSWLERYSLEDPDLFVEQIPYDETKNYVEGVLSNYWNYLRLYNPEVSRLVSRLSVNSY